MRDDLRFGYNEGIPEDRDTAWGCRLIVRQDGHVDFLADRQDTVGPESQREKLHQFLNAGGPDVSPFRRMKERIASLLVTGDMSTREAREFFVVRTEDITIKANANASAGYCYVCAYFTYAEEGRHEA